MLAAAVATLALALPATAVKPLISTAKLTSAAFCAELQVPTTLKVVAIVVDELGVKTAAPGNRSLHNTVPPPDEVAVGVADINCRQEL